MNQQNDTSGERPRHLWAPWRMEYINGLGAGDDGCFLCDYRDTPANDRENLLLLRGEHTMVVMNRFPYTGGHLLIAPNEHVGQLGDLNDETLAEMMTTLRDCQALLAESLRAEGFNVGFNIGHCAGAGLPDHIHMHIVPRWEGDTNFMTVLGDVRVMPQALLSLYDQLHDLAATKGMLEA